MHSPARLATAAEEKQSGSWNSLCEGKYLTVVFACVFFAAISEPPDRETMSVGN